MPGLIQLIFLCIDIIMVRNYIKISGRVYSPEVIRKAVDHYFSMKDGTKKLLPCLEYPELHFAIMWRKWTRSLIHRTYALRTSTWAMQSTGKCSLTFKNTNWWNTFSMRHASISDWAPRRNTGSYKHWAGDGFQPTNRRNILWHSRQCHGQAQIRGQGYMERGWDGDYNCAQT